MNFKISEEGSPVEGIRNLIIDSKYSQWMCDIRINPKLYGIVQATVNLASNETRTIFTLPHPYTYFPSFIVAWNYPAGTNHISSNSSSTYGIGAINIINSDSTSTTFTPQIDNHQFTIVASNGATAQSNLYAEFRFYVFVDDFPIGLFGDTL